MADAAVQGVAKAARSLRLQKAAVAITQAAAERLRALLNQRDSEFIRLGVRKRGCNGLSYTMTYTSASTPPVCRSQRTPARSPAMPLQGRESVQATIV
jgi:hypothetical protein